MKRILILFVAVSFALVGKAQSFSVTTTYVSFTGDANWSEVPSPANMPAIQNTTGDTIVLRWVRVEENIPGWWRSSLCRASYCYSIPDDSGTFTILPGGQDMLYVHIYPYGYVDTGNVVVKLFDVNNPADSSRITFHADLTTSIQEHQAFSFIHTDLFAHAVRFSPSEEGTWTMTDNAGRVIEQHDVQPGEIYATRVPTAGLYFFCFINANGVKKVRKLIL